MFQEPKGVGTFAAEEDDLPASPHSNALQDTTNLALAGLVPKVSAPQGPQDHRPCAVWKMRDSIDLAGPDG